MIDIQKKILKFIGPFFLFFGIVLIIFFVKIHSSSNSIISTWLVYSALSISQVLPLIGLGVSFSFIKLNYVFILLLIYMVAFFIGLNIYDKIWILFTNSTNSISHMFLTLPIVSLCSGILLVLPNSIRKFLIYPFTGIIAFMIAITVKLTDPTLHNPIIPKLGLLISLWIIFSIMLIIRFFYKKWFLIAIRIFGSWLVASGLLYGGFAIAIKHGVIIIKDNNLKKMKENNIKDENFIIPDFTQEN